jgi:hypothetical protein
LKSFLPFFISFNKLAGSKEVENYINECKATAAQDIFKKQESEVQKSKPTAQDNHTLTIDELLKTNCIILVCNNNLY